MEETVISVNNKIFKDADGYYRREFLPNRQTGNVLFESYHPLAGPVYTQRGNSFFRYTWMSKDTVEVEKFHMGIEDYIHFREVVSDKGAFEFPIITYETVVDEDATKRYLFLREMDFECEHS